MRSLEWKPMKVSFRRTVFCVCIHKSITNPVILINALRQIFFIVFFNALMVTHQTSPKHHFTPEATMLETQSGPLAKVHTSLTQLPKNVDLVQQWGKKTQTKRWFISQFRKTKNQSTHWGHCPALYLSVYFSALTYFGPITLNSIIYGLIDMTHTSVEALPRRSSLPAILSIHQCDPNSNHSNIMNHLWPSWSES